MQAISLMTKILKDGGRVVVSNRGGNRIIQRFCADGTLRKTKVKNITRENISNKKVVTRKELFYEGEQHFATGISQVTTDRVYSSSGELLGMRTLSKVNADTCNHDLRTVMNNMKNSKDTYINKQFLTPQGEVYKNITIGENGLKECVTYLPNQYGVGHFVPANEHGIINQQIAGLDFLF